MDGDELTARRRLSFEQSARKRARAHMNMTEEELDNYIRNSTPDKIDALFNRSAQVPKSLQFPEISDKFTGNGIIFDDWLKLFTHSSGVVLFEGRRCRPF
eukprot:SAG11_NODE_1430_length_4938_cov_7.155197_2_plen_100_part_00